MVSKHTTAGLIATTRVDVSSALDELATLCDWPLLLGANPRRLAREMALHNPECVLFWLDECQAVMPTAAARRVVTRTRQSSISRRGRFPDGSGHRSGVSLGWGTQFSHDFLLLGQHAFGRFASAASHNRQIENCSGEYFHALVDRSRVRRCGPRASRSGSSALKVKVPTGCPTELDFDSISASLNPITAKPRSSTHDSQDPTTRSLGR